MRRLLVLLTIVIVGAAAVVAVVVEIASRNSRPVAVQAHPIPAAYRDAIRRAGHRCHAISPALLAAQLDVESGFDPRAVSSAGAQGIAQFLPSTWAAWGQDTDHNGSASPFDPYDAIATAARYDCYLADALKDLPGNRVSNMLAAYNAGPMTVIRDHGLPAYSETSDYVAHILALEPTYARRIRAV